METKKQVDHFDLTPLYKKYKGMWVAMDSPLKKVVASGSDALKVYDTAVKKGIKIPTLFRVPNRNIAYIGVLDSNEVEI